MRQGFREQINKLVSLLFSGLFPLSIAGFILDNRWTNAFLCRNRSWKRRCTKCGLCVSVCPLQRLHDDDTGPHPHMPAGPVPSACSASICAPTMLCRYCLRRVWSATQPPMAGTGSKEQRNIFTVIVNHVPNFSQNIFSFLTKFCFIFSSNIFFAL